ncbi:MAG TPA: pitrilysin family protein, partial [Polyangium sp.]|nr:pitrilysin family protein [Polyangium sp.]
MLQATRFAKKNLSKFTLLGSLVFGMAGTGCGGCQTMPRQGLVMRDIQYAIEDIQFPSGLRVLAEEDRRSPVVALILVVGAGSTSDPPGKEGLAHYVEHLTFRSRPFGNSNMAQMLEASGTGQWTATVGFDSTVYSDVGPKEALGPLLRLEGIRMMNPVEQIAPAVIPVEMNVVRNELRQRNETGFISEIIASMQRLLFPESHPYSRPQGGTHVSLSNISADDVTAFVEKHYRPDNMTLLIIGDIDLNEIKTLVKQSLPPQLIYGAKSNPPASRIPPVAPAPPAPPAPAPSTLPTQEVAVATPELWVGWSLPRSFDADAYLVDFANSTVRNALWNAEREDEDIAFVDTFIVGGKDASMLLCRVGLTRGGHPDRTYEHVLNALSRAWTLRELSVKEIKLDEREMRKNQRIAVVDMMLGAENISTRGISRAVTTHFTGDPDLYSRTSAQVMALEPPQIAEFARKYVNRERARGIVLRPPKGGGELPAAAPLGVHTGVEEEHGLVRADVERLQSIFPGVGVAGFRKVTLKNGLEVVLANRPGLPVVSAQLLIRGGLGAAANLAAAQAAIWLQWSNMVWHSEPAEVGARLEKWGGRDSTTYSMAGSSPNTEFI